MQGFVDSHSSDGAVATASAYLKDRKVRICLCGLAVSALLLLGFSQAPGRGPHGIAPGPIEAGGGAEIIKHVDHDRVEATWEKILANIGARAGAADGLVIASPSKSVPDYYYTWTRDSALVLSSLLSSLTSPLVSSPSIPPSLSAQPLVEELIRSYIREQAKVQLLETPSGGFWTGGLGEPKYMVDGSVFEGSWGRPQRDGPPLRALLLLQYSSYLLNLTGTTPSTRSSKADLEFVKRHMYDPNDVGAEGKVLKADLEYSGKRWDEGLGFDLWEEIKGTHFFGLAVTARALRLGASLATYLDDPFAAEFYEIKSREVSEAIENGFWHKSRSSDEGEGYLKATKEQIPKEKVLGEGFRTGLDCALPLGMIHGVYEDAANPLAPNGTVAGSLATDINDDRYLATLRMYVKSFDGLYGLNGEKGKGLWTDGWLVGRYAEDLYDGWGIKRDGANPWYICSYSMAHVLRLLANQFQAAGAIRISKINRLFWADILSAATESPRAAQLGRRSSTRVSPGSTFYQGHPDFESALDGLLVVADRFEGSANDWVGQGWSMSEQIQRDDGSLVGATDLTWSYASWFALVRYRTQ